MKDLRVSLLAFFRATVGSYNTCMRCRYRRRFEISHKDVRIVFPTPRMPMTEQRMLAGL